MKQIIRLIVALSLSATVCGLTACEGDPIGSPETPEKPSGEESLPGEDVKVDEAKELSLVYYDNIDKVKCTSGIWYNLAEAYLNPVGSGCDALSYESSYAKVNSAFESLGYPGASGVNSVYFAQGGSYIKIKGIAIPSNEKSFRLSLGINNQNDDNTVSFGKNISILIKDGQQLDSQFKELSFKTVQFSKWVYAYADFELVAPDCRDVTVWIKAVSDRIRIDDIRLATIQASPEQKVEFLPTMVHGYAERPKALVNNPNYKYIDHRATTYSSKKEVRNYEACYDISRHNPMWVAFPAHDIYNEGGTRRPSRDPWRPDPNMTDSQQSVIYYNDWESWPKNTYRYWGRTNQGGTCGRGHLMASSDRGCGDPNVLLELNVQTFYPTNIAPEMYVNDNGTTSHWGIVERHRQDYWKCKDTLYIVIGCVYEHSDWITYDRAIGSQYDDGSKPCAVPSARYLVAMRTKSGATGKPVWECSASELMDIGFWFPQRCTSSMIETLPPLSEYIFSVADIEKKAGGEFEFFPEIPAEVKASYDISAWPRLSDVVN